MSAKNEIQINGNLTAFTGSEVHIFTDDMFPDCIDFTAFRELTSLAAANETKAEENSEIELRFNLPNQKFDVKVIPNPGFGRFQIECPHSSLLNSRLELYNSCGSLIYKNFSSQTIFILDIETLPSGIYTLMIQNTEGIKTIKKVVKY